MSDRATELDAKLHQVHLLMVECMELANIEALRAEDDDGAAWRVHEPPTPREVLLSAAGEMTRAWRLWLQACDRRAEVVWPTPDDSESPF